MIHGGAPPYSVVLALLRGVCASGMPLSLKKRKYFNLRNGFANVYGRPLRLILGN